MPSEHHTPNDIHAMNHSRRLSDAMFEQGGADVTETERGEVLGITLTAHQIETIHHATEGLTSQEINRALGLLSLSDAKLMTDAPRVQDSVHTIQPSGEVVVFPYDAYREESAISDESLQRRSENSEKLGRAIEDVTARYAGIHADRIPPVSANKRSLLSQEVKAKLITTKHWYVHKQTGRLDTHYKSRLTYSPGEKTNQITQYETQITEYGPKSKKDFKDQYVYVPEMKVAYENGAIARIEFDNLNPTSEGQNAIFKKSDGGQTPFWTFFKSVIPKTGLRYEVYIELGELPKLVVPYCGEYEYESYYDKFVLTGTPEIYRQGTHVGDRPDSVSVSRFLAIVDDALSIIPSTRAIIPRVET